MSLHKTKQQLIQQLGQADNCVIALSGNWGTGKTHLWNDVKTESGDDKIKNALYVSLFGLKTVDQLKRKLIETAIPGLDSHRSKLDGIKNIFRASVTAASEHYKALAAINEINVLLMAPVLLRNKLIVIDDIERKHEKLGLDEVLGFIDEYSKQHTSRFILVLNDDQLSANDNQKRLWTILREKVIDQEIKLSTSSEEAFSIAIRLRPSKYAEAIKQASITCSLTNIRIIVKVIKVTNLILADRDMDEFLQARVVPSIVFFSAIHYRGIDDGPDFKFALNVGNMNLEAYFKDDNELHTVNEKREGGWKMLMQELGIRSCDEFEKLLVEFLESGLLEAASINAVIDRYAKEIEEMKARDSAQNFLLKVTWDHRVDASQLLVEAADFPAIAEFLDPFVATELYIALAQLPGGEEIGDKIISAWIKGFKQNNQSTVKERYSFSNQLHSKIIDEFDRIKFATQASMSVVDACMHIIDHNSWGTLQEVAMRQATEADFELAIRELEDLDKLRRFMRQMIKMRIQRANYDPYFGTATECFVKGCQSIANDVTSPRLAGLVKRLFGSTVIESELTSQSNVVEQTPHS